MATIGILAWMFKENAIRWCPGRMMLQILPGNERGHSHIYFEHQTGILWNRSSKCLGYTCRNMSGCPKPCPVAKHCCTIISTNNSCLLYSNSSFVGWYSDTGTDTRGCHTCDVHLSSQLQTQSSHRSSWCPLSPFVSNTASATDPGSRLK